MCFILRWPWNALAGVAEKIHFFSLNWTGDNPAGILYLVCYVISLPDVLTGLRVFPDKSTVLSGVMINIYPEAGDIS